MVRATWSPNRTSRSKFSNTPKFYTGPELDAAFKTIVQLKREGVVGMFRTNEPKLLGKDENGRDVRAIPDCEFTTTTPPPNWFVLRIMGTKWHPIGDEDDEKQKKLMEKLGITVIDIFVDDKTKWEDMDREIRDAIKTGH